MDYGLEHVSQENIIMTFGCQPSSGVPVKSTIARAYFSFLRQQALQDAEKRIALPGNLSFFTGTDGKCEHVTKVAQPLLLQWSDKETNQSAPQTSAPAQPQPSDL